MTTILDGPDEVRAAVGRHLGASEPLVLDDDRLRRWSEAVGHGEVEPLVLALSNHFLPEIVEVRGFRAGVNYGAESVRFTGPVSVGDQLQAEAELLDVINVPGGMQTRIRITISVLAVDNPSIGGESAARTGEPVAMCVIESLSRWLT